MVEYIVAGAVTVGVVALDESVKTLCKRYLRQQGQQKGHEYYNHRR